MEATAAAHSHPIRLVVADDLRRSRLTVFFRFLLGIPHFFWLALFGVGVGAAVFANWWATLFRGQSPKGLHGFIAGYLRYLTHVEAYLFLAANPYPPFYFGDQTKPYPVDLEIDPPAPQNRWVTFFRLFLAIPAMLLSAAFVGGVGGPSGYFYFRGGILFLAAFLLWFVALSRGRAARGLRDLAAWSLGYNAQASAYLFLLTDRYPNSSWKVHLGRRAAAARPLDEAARLAALAELQAREPDLPLTEAMARLDAAAEAPPAEDLPEGTARVVVDDDLRRSRLTVFFRLLLAFPHIVWIILWGVLAVVAAFVNWLAALVTGRSPRALARFLAAFVRYQTHVQAFLYLTANPFPGFTGRAGSYPVSVELDPFARQRRLVTLFRIVLAIPAWMISGALSGLLFVTALLGWFASLVRGRMPEGLRDAGAHALGYQAQLNAYLFVLSDRYPYSGPR